LRAVWLILHEAESKNVTADVLVRLSPKFSWSGDLLTEFASLNHWILYFIVEARNQEGKPYPPSSCKTLLSTSTRHRCLFRETHLWLSKSLMNFWRVLIWSTN